MLTPGFPHRNAATSLHGFAGMLAKSSATLRSWPEISTEVSGVKDMGLTQSPKGN